MAKVRKKTESVVAAKRWKQDMRQGRKRQRPTDGGVVFAGRWRLTGGRPRTAVAKPAGGKGPIVDGPWKPCGGARPIIDPTNGFFPPKPSEEFFAKVAAGV